MFALYSPGYSIEIKEGKRRNYNTKESLDTVITTVLGKTRAIVKFENFWKSATVSH